MSKPERIQLRRTAGWRLPQGAVSVARPTKWGNPFTVKGAIEFQFADDTADGREVCVTFHRNWLLRLDPAENESYDFGKYDRRWVSDHIEELRGKTLACWCPAGAPCHADLLIELANFACTFVAIVEGTRYPCHSHEDGKHHFAAGRPDPCHAPFCRLAAGHRTLHDIPAGHAEVVDLSA